MIRRWDIIVVLIFAGIASALITPLLTVTLPWYVSFAIGVALSYLHDAWKHYEIFRVAYEKVKRRDNQ